MDPDALGSFEFDPGTSLDVTRLEQVLDEVSRHASRIDALLLPEAVTSSVFWLAAAPRVSGSVIDDSR